MSTSTCTFEFRLEPTHLAASETRGRLRRCLVDEGVAAPLVDDMELVASELLANAVEHGLYGSIEVGLGIDDATLHLTVTNRRPPGPPVEPVPVTPSGDAPADRGRGLAIVHALADGVWFHGGEDTTSVSCLRNRAPSSRS